MQELEKLLNSMIKKWWKPWGKEYTAIDVIQDGREECLMFWDAPKRQMKAYTFRSLVSIESGLWAFVCTNNLYRHTGDELVLNPSWGPDWPSADWSFFSANTEYRLLESALIPEKELAQFLLDNIKVAWIMN